MADVLVIHIDWNGISSFINRNLNEDQKRSLEEHGIEYDVFEIDTSANMDELIDDILAEEYNSILLLAQPVSYRFAELIKEKLKEEMDDEKIQIYHKKELDSIQTGFQERKNMKLGQAMMNGYFAYTTGMYPEYVAGLYTKHVGCENSDYLGDLGEYLNINSAVIEQREQYALETYGKRIKYTMEEMVYVPHYHQLVKAQDEIKLYIDDTGMTQHLYKCSYQEFYNLEEKNEVSREVLYICSMRSFEDLECFLKDVKKYEETGEIRIPNFALEDECRWYDRCSMKYLTRMNITKDGKVNPCNGCSQCIGDIKDSYYVNIRKAARCADQSFLSRSCNECQVKEICSKCAMLPEFLEEESYCKLRKEHLLFADFIDKKNMYYFLFQFSMKFKKQDKLTFSNQLYSSVFPEEQNKKIDCSKKVYLFHMHDNHILFNMKENALFDIDSKLTFILEGYIKNFSNEEIAERFAKSFGGSLEEGVLKTEKAMQFLKNAGVIC